MRTRTSATCVLVLVLLALGVRPAAAESAKLVVVVSAKSPVTGVSRLELKRAFLGEPIVIGDTRLAPFNAEPNSAERGGFDQSVLGMTPEEAGRFWIDRKVRGQGAAPRSLPAVHLAKVVAKFPGAISYLRIDQLTPEVKALTVDGLAYSDRRYTIVTR
ncbi:MAG: hypothetical protein M3680_16280 [Myxococcota bacterium]|nr:hypothetical protein [Myxococcota bacterium]